MKLSDKTYNILINIAAIAIVAIGGAAIISAGYILSCVLRPVHKGERVGQIIKLSQGGILFKTYEGELIKGGMSNGSGGFAAPLNFTIKNPLLLQQAKTALLNGKEVVVYYHTEKHCLTTSDTKNCTFADKIQFH